MFDLVLSVLCSSLIFVIFKLFSIYNVETLYAIITNYMVAFIVGILFYQGEVKLHIITEKPWFWGTFALGLLFIIVFNLMALTSQKLGVSVASVATKMSLVLPVLFGVFMYQEELEPFKIVGIILALIAVYFTSIKAQSASVKTTAIVLPIFVFLGSGAIDISLGYFQKRFITPFELPLFSAIVFASAASIGLILILIKSIKKSLKINLRNVAGGIVLGVPNYFSIYFLLRALDSDALNSSTVFTVNNVAIVMFSTLLGILIFKEQISAKNWGGIALAIISIILVAIF